MAITTSAPYGAELEYMPLEAFGGVGGFKLKPIPGSLQLHGGGARRVIAPVIAITAAVAIPFAVPAVVAAVGASSAIAAAATGIATGAVIGAAGGAAAAAIGGGNVGQGALIGGIGGGIGGGISGYAAAPAATTATGSVAPTTGALPATTPAATTTLGTSPTVATGTGLGGTTTPFTSQIAQQVSTGTAAPSFVTPVTSTTPGSLGAALSGGVRTAASYPGGVAPLGTVASTGVGGFVPGVAPSVPSGLGMGGTTVPTTGQIAQQVATGPITTGAGVGSTALPTTAQLAGQVATAPTAATAAAPAGGWASQFGASLMDRVTNPEVAADVVLRAAGQLAGSALAGSGLSPEQQQLVDMQMAELEQLRQQNQAAFNQRLEAATALLGGARYFDPEYFGLQRARRQQLAGAQARRGGLRGLRGEQRRAEARRFDLATARDIGTAYDQGFLTGVQGQLQTQQAGLSALPMPNQFATAYGTVGSTLDRAEQQRGIQAEQIGQLFGGLFGRTGAQSLG